MKTKASLYNKRIIDSHKAMCNNHKGKNLLAIQTDFINTLEASPSNSPEPLIDYAISLLSDIIDESGKPPTRGHRKLLVTISKSLTTCPYLTTRFLVFQWSTHAPHYMANPDEANLAAKCKKAAAILKLELAKHPILK